MGEQIVLEGFAGRKKALQDINRYGGYKTMFYRTTVYRHTHRVLWLAEALLGHMQNYNPDINTDFCRTLAVIHDDMEMVTGDITTNIKERMNQTKLLTHNQQEKKAIDFLSVRFPSLINGFSYKELLFHSLNKDCIEAQLVSFADKCDAFGESLHEIYAGNPYFLPPATLYPYRIIDLLKNYPALQCLQKMQPQITYFPEDFDVENIIFSGKPHTIKSVAQDSGIPLYEFWKSITLQHAGLRMLIKQKEF